MGAGSTLYNNDESLKTDSPAHVSNNMCLTFIKLYTVHISALSFIGLHITVSTPWSKHVTVGKGVFTGEGEEIYNSPSLPV